MKLSPREKQIVAKVVTGSKRKAIASELQIAVSTVDCYLLRIRRKVGVSSMLEVAVYFSREVQTNHSRE